MKWLFVIMILANIGFAAWATHRPPMEELPPKQVVTLPEYVNRLLLLSELDDRSLRERSSLDAPRGVEKDTESHVLDDQAEHAAFASKAICFSVGPLANLEEVGRVDAWLTSRGGISTLREDERREISRF